MTKPTNDNRRAASYRRVTARRHSKTAKPKVDVEQLLAYEAGEMTPEQQIAFFQRLIDSGLVWQLQGHYGRTVTALIKAGHCTDKGGDDNAHSNSIRPKHKVEANRKPKRHNTKRL